MYFNVVPILIRLIIVNLKPMLGLSSWVTKRSVDGLINCCQYEQANEKKTV